MKTGFGVVPLRGAEWQDVDTPEMAAEAERRFVLDEVYAEVG
jgi:hypothetical protein